MIDFIADNFYYVFLAWIVLSLIQRRYRGRGDKKRTATLIQSILIFVVYIGAMVIREESLEEKWIMVPLGAVAVALYFFRSRIIPYQAKCRNCGTKLTMNQIFLYDANLCTDCDPDEKRAAAQEDVEEEEADPAEPESGDALPEETRAEEDPLPEGEPSEEESNGSAGKTE